MSRGQAHVVGVSLMVAVTVLALGGLTMTIGSVVDAGASAAEADRVADGMAAVADPSDVVGSAEAELRFGDGSLRTENRTVRVIDADDGRVIERVASDALVYEVGDYTVVGASDAVLRVGSGGARMVDEPSVAADREPGGVLVIGAPDIDGPDRTVSTTGAARVGVRTTVEHERRDLGQQRVRVAVETAHPRPWAAYFEDRGATVVDRRAGFADDRHDSVVAEFDGERQTYLVVHHAEMEVAYS